VTDKDRAAIDPADVAITPGPAAPTDFGSGAGGCAESNMIPPVNALIKQVSSRRVPQEDANANTRGNSGGGGNGGREASGGAGSSGPTSVNYLPVTSVDAAVFTKGHPAAPLHTESIQHVIVTENEGETVSCAADKTIVVYNWRTRTAGEKYSNHSKSVQRVVYSARHKALFSASRDSTIRQWRNGVFKEVQAFRGHTLAVTGLLLHVAPTGASTLISGARDYSLRTWSVETGQQTAMKTLGRNVVTNLRWMAPDAQGSGSSSNGNTFLGGSFIAARRDNYSSAAGARGADEEEDPVVLELLRSTSPSPSPSSPASSRTTQPPGGLAADMGAGFDAHCLLQCSEDPGAGVRIWDVRCMEVVSTFGSVSGGGTGGGGGGGEGGFVTTDAMSDPEDCNFIVSTTGTYTHSNSNDQHSSSSSSSSSTSSSSSSSLSSSQSSGAELRLWDRRVASSNTSLSSCPSASTPLISIAAHDDTINSMAFLPASSRVQASGGGAGGRGICVATVSKDRTMRVWDLSAAALAAGSAFGGGAAAASPAAIASASSAAASSPISYGDSSGVRCVQSLSFRDKKYSTDLTSLALQSRRPASDQLLSLLAAPSSKQVEQFVLYAGGSNGALSCWVWNPAQMRLALTGHTAPTQPSARQ
jgi:WD40 repeat protein